MAGKVSGQPQKQRTEQFLEEEKAMLSNLFSKLMRTMLVMMILAVIAMALPSAASAAAPAFDVIRVVPDQSVTFRAYDFPANVVFIIRMDVSGNRAVNGIAVAQFNSGVGGSFEATVNIPASLKGTRTIDMRLESTQGYFAYNWFTNSATGTNPPTIPVTGVKSPWLTFTGVKANELVTVEATGLPANTTMTVRVGPFYTFFKDFVYTPSVKTDANGYAKWTIELPDVAEDAEMVTVRVDGGGHYAFNAFKNVTSGTTGSVIPVTGGSSCQVLSTTPTTSVSAGSDQDVTWTVKNNSTRTWNLSSVDYKYVSGSKFYNEKDRYDLRQTVKPGETVKVIVDVTAPNTAGSYTTNWALVEGSSTICSLSYTLRVK
jgi:hypothetical protein